MVIRYDGDLFQIVKYDHVTPGNWRAIHHLNLKNLKTGRQKEVRMNTSDTIEPVFMEARSCQYLYRDSSGHVFMDNQNYDQFHLGEEVMEDAKRFLVESDNVDVLFVDDSPLSFQFPASVVIEVQEAEEAARGDTVANVQKNAVLVTGYNIKVPAHIKVGDKVKVSTESGEFLGRA
jgi:elongation factor P